MEVADKAEALLEAIERRLTDISERQHALAVEKVRLLEHITPLRLGVASPDTIVVQLRGQGITLPGLATAWSTTRRPRGVVLKAVRCTAAPLPFDRSASA